MNNKFLILSIILIASISVILFLRNKFFLKRFPQSYNDMLITKLNSALADEWLAHYQYWLGSKVLTGELKKEINEELIQHSNEELKHAGMLADKIIELGGVPILEPKKWYSETICGYTTPKNFDGKTILQENIDGEICAIKVYTELSNFVDPTLRQAQGERDEKTIKMIQEILDDEIEHQKDLEELLNKL
ncbi:MAG: ferritin-like domain-containing protein [bacterium]